MLNVAILNVAFYVLLCWVSLCWMSLCWVLQVSPLCWVSLCRISLCWMNIVMLSVTNKPIMFCVIMMIVIMLIVIMLNVVAPYKHSNYFWRKKVSNKFISSVIKKTDNTRFQNLAHLNLLLGNSLRQKFSSKSNIFDLGGVLVSLSRLER